MQTEPVLTSEDHEAWQAWMDAAAVHAKTKGFQRRLDLSRYVVDVIREVAPDAAVYWSGGKDSTVLTHLVCVDRGWKCRVYSEKDDLDYPGEREYVERLAREWELDLEIVSPDFSLKHWMDKNCGSALDDVHSRRSALSKAAFYPLCDALNERHECSILGLRAAESKFRSYARVQKKLATRDVEDDRVRKCNGLFYPIIRGGTTSGKWRASPLGDWSSLDVYAYAASRGIELLPVYKCVAFMHSDDPARIRKSWWVPGSQSSKGGVAWLRHYYPSLYKQLQKWTGDASLFA